MTQPPLHFSIVALSICVFVCVFFAFASARGVAAGRFSAAAGRRKTAAGVFREHSWIILSRPSSPSSSFSTSIFEDLRSSSISAVRGTSSSANKLREEPLSPSMRKPRAEKSPPACGVCTPIVPYVLGILVPEHMPQLTTGPATSRTALFVFRDAMRRNTQRNCAISICDSIGGYPGA